MKFLIPDVILPSIGVLLILLGAFKLPTVNFFLVVTGGLLLVVSGVWARRL